jgi:glutathione reductase (NADPH)
MTQTHFDLTVIGAGSGGIAIIGSGYIAIELASILNQLGSQVHVLLRKNCILSNFDSELSTHLMKLMEQQGITFHKKHQASEITRQNKKLKIHCKNSKKLAGFDTVLFAIGGWPRTHSVRLANAGVKLNKDKFITTDKKDKTNITHIYAVGDITGKKMLTPVAIAAGRKLATRLFGKDKKTIMDYENIPTVIFSNPPLGSVGMSEEDAIKQYGKQHITIYKAEFISLMYALDKKKVTSIFKLITLKKSQKIIGCYLLDPKADEILQGFAAAIKMGATKKDFDNVIAIHPSSAEELIGMVE